MYEYKVVQVKKDSAGTVLDRLHTDLLINGVNGWRLSQSLMSSFSVTLIYERKLPLYKRFIMWWII